jgi:hypothetical protein
VSRGRRAEKRIKSVNHHRYNIFAAIGTGGLAALEIYEGKGTLDCLMHFTMEDLLKDCNNGGVMNAYPGDNSVIVIDNSTVHHARRDLFERVCAVHGVRVEFLPRYVCEMGCVTS